MDSFRIQEGWKVVNKLLSIVLIVLTIAVSLPLSITTYKEAGGPWGFGIVGLHILLPLTMYVLFAVPAFLKVDVYQRTMFIAAHVVTVCTGFVGFLLFPLAPKLLLLIPVMLAVAGIYHKRRLTLYISVMLILGIAANVVLMKWELDFGRSLPIVSLFQESPNVDP